MLLINQIRRNVMSSALPPSAFRIYTPETLLCAKTFRHASVIALSLSEKSEPGELAALMLVRKQLL